MKAHLDKNPPARIRFDDGARSVLFTPASAGDARAEFEAVRASLDSLKVFMPWAHTPQTLEGQRERLSAAQTAYASGAEYLFFARYVDGGPVVANVGLHRATSNPKALELGYWVTTGFTGQGLATLASQVMTVLVFDYFGYERLQCGYNEANVGSQIVNERLGFVEEARLRRFEDTGTEEMIADGYGHGEYTVMTALFPEDRASLAWYPKIAPNLTALDQDGQTILPRFSITP